LYAGGAFTTAGGVVVNGVGRWDGSAWEALGTGVNGRVRALLVNGADVYVGGDFTMAGGVVVNGIAKWDGSEWNALGQGVGGGAAPSVTSLAMIGTNLYAGGGFLTAGGAYVGYVARWDGGMWSALGTGTDNRVSALAVIGGDLFAGGYFRSAGGVDVSYVAKWNGAAWSALGAGYPNRVNALAVSGSRLYVGGNSGVSFWDGSSWSGLPPAIEGVNALTVCGTNLYVGGFYSFKSETGHCLAKWDGNAWSALGSDIAFGNPSPVIKALAVDAGNHLFVGGAYFTTVGNGTRSPYLAQANLPTPAPDIVVTQSAALSDGTGGVDFGPVVASGGNAALTFTLTNPGDAELSGLSVSVDGATASEFAVSTLTRSSFVPGESLTFTVTYTPAAMAGSNAALHIVSNVSGDKASFDIALGGLGVTANQGWQQQYFGVITGAGNAAPGADPNHNGIPNLLEYALGGDPVGASTGSSVLPCATVNEGAHCLQLNFKRYVERKDVTLTVQAADSPAGPWIDVSQSTNGGPLFVLVPGVNTVETVLENPRSVTVFDSYQTTDPAHPRRFMRLKVSQ
ncbi:MAG: hypothetical protein JWR15_2574, partial [Prosthecobacter sp.]|nr:hypothetical protein [Prosthecobacter sp.]